MPVIKLIRYIVAFVFITSALMKIVHPSSSEYFINSGFPSPLTLMYVIAMLEIVCGILIFANKYVKEASMPLLAIIIAALVFTKVPYLQSGLIVFLFNARLDITIFLLLVILYQHYPRIRI